MNKSYNTIIIGAGAAGMLCAITSAKRGKKVLLLEKLSSVGMKLKATGGGRCNLTNTLEGEEFMACFGRNGRFMTTALESFNNQDVIEFFHSIGVKTASRDGFRVFPDSHNSMSIIDGLQKAMSELNITISCEKEVTSIEVQNSQIVGVKTLHDNYLCDSVIIATGGKGYPSLGATGDGYELAKKVGHKVTDIYPAMTPLKTKESWMESCRGDTMAKVKIVVDMKKHKKLSAVGDLIFTKDGIRGPVVLDFAREITPLIEKYGEVPLLLNLTKALNEEQIRAKFIDNHTLSCEKVMTSFLPKPLSLELCKLCDANPDTVFSKLSGVTRDKLIKILAWTPLTITGDQGFEKAMITRGGISLKEIDPKTMQSRLIDGLYFCGEVMDLDGPCGGYNLQWSFSSGYLAGLTI